jgi:hypothetical protein
LSSVHATMLLLIFAFLAIFIRCDFSCWFLNRYIFVNNLCNIDVRYDRLHGIETEAFRCVLCLPTWIFGVDKHGTLSLLASTKIFQLLGFLFVTGVILID